MLPGDLRGCGSFRHFQAQHHAALLSLTGIHPGRLVVQQQLQVLAVDAAQALPGAQLLLLPLMQQCGKPARRKLGGIADAHPLRPVGKFCVVGAGAGSKQLQILPPPLLQGFALRGKLGVEHLQQGALFRVGALLPVCRVAQQRIFLLQYPHIAAVTGQIPGVQLAQRSVQKFAPPLRSPLDKAQVAGVEHHRRKAACQCRRPLGRCAVYRRIAAGLCGFRGAHGHADVGRLSGLTAFRPVPLGVGFQHRKCFSPAHKLGILTAPEAFAAGQQPDGF